MLNKPLDKIIWLDIESIPEKESFFDLSPRKQKLFMEKFKKDVIELGLDNPSRVSQEVKETNIELEADERAAMEKLYANKAPLFPEFGQIICISIGFMKKGIIPANIKDLSISTDLGFQSQSFYGSDEKELLKKFHAATASIIDTVLNKQWSICSHNGFNFDWPYIGKKFILHGLPIPAYFDYGELKPWDLTWFIDTKNIWKWGVWDGNVSLDLLCEIFNVKSPKEQGMSGKDVRDVYYIEKNLPKIAKYCELDISQLALIYLRLKGLPNNLKIN